MILPDSRVSMIVAISSNRGIGKDGDQPFFISEDLKRFKKLTTGNTIIMGRKTFEALPKGALPNRRNIVITTNREFTAPNCDIVFSPEEALSVTSDSDSIFIIGGGTIYSAMLPYTTTLYLTEVHKSFEVDTLFPEISPSEWSVVEREDKTCIKSDLPFSFITYSRANM